MGGKNSEMTKKIGDSGVEKRKVLKTRINAILGTVRIRTSRKTISGGFGKYI